VEVACLGPRGLSGEIGPVDKERVDGLRGVTKRLGCLIAASGSATDWKQSVDGEESKIRCVDQGFVKKQNLAEAAA